MRFKNYLTEVVHWSRNKGEDPYQGTRDEQIARYWPFFKDNTDNYTIAPDGRITVHGDVDLHNQTSWRELPDVMNFEEIRGDFKIKNNKLESFKNFPHFVDGDFTIQGNRFTSLQGLPNIVVGGSMDVSDNMLTSLQGCPKYVEGNFNCDHNDLTNLVGGPTQVSGKFSSRGNKLESLEGIPKIVGDLDLQDEHHLHTLEGIGDMIQTFTGYSFYMNESLIELGGLGLLNIDAKFLCTFQPMGACKIINEYTRLPKDQRDIFECQQRLIDAGFENNAVL